MKKLSRRRLMQCAGLSIAGSAILNSLLVAAEIVGTTKNVVITGGHPGDPEYGCGGTAARLAAAGMDVAMLYLNKGEPKPGPGQKATLPHGTRVSEAKKACEILRARAIFAGQIDAASVVDRPHYDHFHSLLAAENPIAVFTHWPLDNHADHRAMFMLVFEAWRRMKKSFALFYYEVSDGEDTLQFIPTDYVDISRTASLKKEACYAYASQTPERYYSLQESVTKMRGLESGHHEAEAFVRQVQSAGFILPS